MLYTRIHNNSRVGPREHNSKLFSVLFFFDLFAPVMIINLYAPVDLSLGENESVCAMAGANLPMWLKRIKAKILIHSLRVYRKT